MVVSGSNAWAFLLPANARDWFAQRLASVATEGVASDCFAAAWTQCGRRLGRTVLQIGNEEAQSLHQAGVRLLPSNWEIDTLGRVVLLLTAARATPGSELLTVTEELFRTGEMRERQALLKALPYLPEPERFVGIATEAVRSNVVSVIEAIACDNPFPAHYMPEPAFNQLVVKSLFNDVPLGRVIGLCSRINPELQRMVAAYVSERKAAGRSVPADVDFVLSPSGANNASV